MNSCKVVTAWDCNLIVGAGRMLFDGYYYDELMNEKAPLFYLLKSSFSAQDFYYNLGCRKHKTVSGKYSRKSYYLED